jgi:hypothetical protein
MVHRIVMIGEYDQRIFFSQHSATLFRETIFPYTLLPQTAQLPRITTFMAECRVIMLAAALAAYRRACHVPTYGVYNH